ncbi:hypothetical protein POM88_002535 [Heracleum sosnowskyi]|uniref:Uncharacterized protein n=1 Tax=Heracleum sosnowskyi TaxID=360622 RepID=A0AAD8N603_9APIA|nr:hypothetical protein POM88_002535 [Heracleum sosnowskyi]
MFLATQHDQDTELSRQANISNKIRILDQAHNKSKIEKKVHSVIDNIAECGLRSLGVARQEVPEGNKDSSGGPSKFIALLPLFDPVHHDSAETIRRALELGFSVKMITHAKEKIQVNKFVVLEERPSLPWDNPILFTIY